MNEQPANNATPENADLKTRRSILKSSIVMSSMTVLARIFGLVREQVRGIYLGTGMESDAFGIASTIPNLLRRLFAEGAMTAAFVPVFTEIKTKEEQARVNAFFSGFMTLFILLMLAVTLLGIAFSGPIVRYIFASNFAAVPGKVDLTIVLTQVMFPYLFLVSIASIIQASLNSYRVFGPSAFTPVLLSIAIIVAVVFFSSFFPNPAWALSIGFVVGGLFQLLFQLPYLYKTGVRFRATFAGLKDDAVKQVSKLFLPGILGAGVYQINTAVAQIVATSLNEGSVASLQYSLRLQELVLGVFAVSIAQVILPTMSEQAAVGNHKGLRDTLEFSVGLLALVTIPATIGLMLLGVPIVRVLFEYGRFDAESTRMTTWALYFHSAGILFIALQRNVVQVFFAMKDTRTPVIVALIVMGVHIALCFLLAGPLENGGIAAAGSIAAVLNVILLYMLLRRRIGPLDAGRITKSMVRILGATAAMSVFLVALLYADFFEGHRALALGWRVGVALLGAMVIYVGTARVLKTPELEEFTVMARRRFDRMRRR